MTRRGQADDADGRLQDKLADMKERASAPVLGA